MNDTPPARRKKDSNAEAADGADEGRTLRRAFRRLTRPQTSRDEVEQQVLALFAAYARHAPKRLLPHLLSADPKIFSTIGIIVATLRLAADDAEAVQQLKTKFARFGTADAAAPRWTERDRVKFFAKSLPQELAYYVNTLKYVGAPDNFQDLDDATRYFAGRFYLAPEVLDALYEASTDGSDDRDTYIAALYRGFVAEHIVNDLVLKRRRHPDVPSIGLTADALWNTGSFEHPTPNDGPERPTIFLGMHGGMLDQVKAWFEKVSDGGIRMGSGRSESVLSSRDNPNGALLAAYRAALGGQSLLIAADSPMGNARNKLEVLGRTLPVADGFVFLAFETRAHVFFITVVRRAGRLSPRLVPGPSRKDGERIDAYRDRLLAFVQQALTDYLVGNPEDINLRGKWIDILSGDAGRDDLE